MTTLLVIEDEDEIRNNICTALEFEGFTTRSAENGKVGLQTIQAEPPDLIFCDIVMPEMDGLELLQILNDHPNHQDIPVVLLSARTSQKDIERGLKAGAVDFIKKPFSVSQLLDAIDKTLGGGSNT